MLIATIFKCNYICLFFLVYKTCCGPVLCMYNQKKIKFQQQKLVHWRVALDSSSRAGMQPARRKCPAGSLPAEWAGVWGCVSTQSH